jgi:hypothetical protein
MASTSNFLVWQYSCYGVGFKNDVSQKLKMSLSAPKLSYFVLSSQTFIIGEFLIPVGAAI